MSVMLAPDFVLTLLDRDAEGHGDAADWVLVAEEDLVTTPLALAVIDDGAGAEAPAVREDFARGAYAVRWWADALDETLAISRRRQLDGRHETVQPVQRFAAGAVAMEGAGLAFAVCGRLRPARIGRAAGWFRPAGLTLHGIIHGKDP